MTHTPEDMAIRAALKSLTSNGLDGMGEVLKIERAEFLQAVPYQRSEKRVGHADSFKDKSTSEWADWRSGYTSQVLLYRRKESIRA